MDKDRLDNELIEASEAAFARVEVLLISLFVDGLNKLILSNYGCLHVWMKELLVVVTVNRMAVIEIVGSTTFLQTLLLFIVYNGFINWFNLWNYVRWPMLLLFHDLFCKIVLMIVFIYLISLCNRLLLKCSKFSLTHKFSGYLHIRQRRDKGLLYHLHSATE